MENQSEKRKTIIVSLSGSLCSNMSIETAEKWNELANRMSSRYTFVFIPSDGAFTTWRVIEDDDPSDTEPAGSLPRHRVVL